MIDAAQSTARLDSSFGAETIESERLADIVAEIVKMRIFPIYTGSIQAQIEL